jgi:hypothetical protein
MIGSLWFVNWCPTFTNVQGVRNYLRLAVRFFYCPRFDAGPDTKIFGRARFRSRGPPDSPPFSFTGVIHSVTFDVTGDLIEDDELTLRRLMVRQ